MAGSGFKRTAEMLSELFSTLSGKEKKDLQWENFRF